VVSTHAVRQPVAKPGGTEQGCWCPGDPPRGIDFFSLWHPSRTV